MTSCLTSRNFLETQFSKSKYIQYKITTICHNVEGKQQIKLAVLFFKKKLRIMLVLPNYAKNNIMLAQSTKA